MFDQILIICVGNICRSPMGEAMFRDNFENKKVTSAGIGALVGEPAVDTAVRLMRERNLDLSGHRARQISEEMLRDSDLVLVMESGHQDWIESRWPQARGRVYRWGHWSNFDIPDPYGRDEVIFRESLKLLDRGLEDWRWRL